MSDLVERLRNEERRVRKFLGPITATQLCNEAADEIERLRDEVQNLKNKLKASGRAKLRAERDALHLALKRLVIHDTATDLREKLPFSVELEEARELVFGDAALGKEGKL